MALSRHPKRGQQRAPFFIFLKVFSQDFYLLTFCQHLPEYTRNSCITSKKEQPMIAEHSLKESVIIIVSDSITTQQLLSHIIQLMGDYEIFSYPNLMSVFRKEVPGHENNRIFFIDTPHMEQEIKFYSDPFGTSRIILIEHDPNTYYCSLQECIIAFEKLQKRILERENQRAEGIIDFSDTDSDSDLTSLSNDEETQKSRSFPRWSTAPALRKLSNPDNLKIADILKKDCPYLNVTGMPKPLTMRSFIQSLNPSIEENFHTMLHAESTPIHRHGFMEKTMDAPIH